MGAAHERELRLGNGGWGWGYLCCRCCCCCCVPPPLLLLLFFFLLFPPPPTVPKAEQIYDCTLRSREQTQGAPVWRLSHHHRNWRDGRRRSRTSRSCTHSRVRSAGCSPGPGQETVAGEEPVGARAVAWALLANRPRSTQVRRGSGGLRKKRNGMKEKRSEVKRREEKRKV